VVIEVGVFEYHGREPPYFCVTCGRAMTGSLCLPFIFISSQFT
jgi:hypothetical protein